MSNVYWVIKLTDSHGSVYLSEEDGYWDLNEKVKDRTKYQSLISCKNAIKKFKQAEKRQCKFIFDPFAKVIPVKITVKKVKKKPYNIPHINSIWINKFSISKSKYLITNTYYDSNNKKWYIEYIWYYITNKNKTHSELFLIPLNKWLNFIEENNMELL